MGGGGSKTTTQDNSPWVAQQGYLTNGYNYAQGILENPTPTPAADQAISTLQGFGDNTNYNAGVNVLNGLTGASDTYNVNASGLTGLGQTGALNGQGTAAQNVLSGLATNGAMDQNGYNAVNGVANGSNLDANAQSYLKSVLSGDYLTQNNPYFQDMVNNSIASARPSVDAAFASSGRLGSGSYAAALADSANRAATTLGYQDYQNERNIQNSAASSLNSAALQDASLRSSAGQGLLSAGFQNAGVQSGAATGLLNSQQQDAATRMNAMQAALSGDQSLRSSQTQVANGLLNASQLPGQSYAQAAALEAANSPTAKLQAYMNIINGNQGSSTTTTAPGVDNTGAYVGAAGSIAAAAAIAI